MMERVLALDVGERRIGIAVSDPLGFSAQGLETYTRGASEEADIAYILSVAARYRPVKLLVGMPRSMNGTYGPQAEKTRAFAGALAEKWDGAILFLDERLTTCAAERVLLQADVSRKKRKTVIDKMAAVLILQSYLDAQI